MPPVNLLVSGAPAAAAPFRTKQFALSTSATGDRGISQGSVFSPSARLDLADPQTGERQKFIDDYEWSGRFKKRQLRMER